MISHVLPLSAAQPYSLRVSQVVNTPVFPVKSSLARYLRNPRNEVACAFALKFCRAYITQSRVSTYAVIKYFDVFGDIYLTSGNSGPITWSEEQLLQWIDSLIQIGYEVGYEFEGCGASAP